IKVLESQDNGQYEGPVLFADFFGPDCQFSHGLSIYFPWSRPIEGASDAIKNYRGYAFETELEGASWLDFLKDYFEATERKQIPIRLDSPKSKAAFDIVQSSIKNEQPNGANEFVNSALTGGKVSPTDASGGSETVISIKNYSKEFTLSKRALNVFAPEAFKGPSPGSR